MGKYVRCPNIKNIDAAVRLYYEKFELSSKDIRLIFDTKSTATESKLKNMVRMEMSIPPMPSWEAVVEMMHDKYLDAFADEVVNVVYSIDKSMRYVILKDEKGFFTYQLEAFYQFDEDEWKYICSHDNTLPAMWEPFRGIVGKSIFQNTEDLMKEMKAEPEYKQYFT